MQASEEEHLARRSRTTRWVYKSKGRTAGAHAVGTVAPMGATVTTRHFGAGLATRERCELAAPVPKCDWS
jgi:uncharacterized protein RhaS with RHS repeats